MAFSLGPEEPFIEEPVVGENAVYVFAFKKGIPSEKPPLETIREKVVDDYKKQEARKLASTDGQLFYASLTNGLARGKSFDEVAKTSGVTPVKVSPFSQITM